MSTLPMDGGQQSKRPKTDPLIKPKSSKSVAVYLVVLFIAAFALLTMAYFMQQRDQQAFDRPQQQTACTVIHGGSTHHH